VTGSHVFLHWNERSALVASARFVQTVPPTQGIETLTRAEQRFVPPQSSNLLEDCCPIDQSEPGFPFSWSSWEKISLPATAAGGHHAKRERHSAKSQEAVGYLAISLVGENLRRKENLSSEANRNGRPDPRPGNCSESARSSSAGFECTNSKLKTCFDDHRPALLPFRTMRIVSDQHLAKATQLRTSTRST
jgi:hypothetical protein